MTARVLIVGARAGSLGEAVRDEVLRVGMEPVCAGVSGEPVYLDLTDSDPMDSVLLPVLPRFIVSTAGVNIPQGDWVGSTASWWAAHFDGNVTGNLRLLAAYRALLRRERGGWGETQGYAHFVAISSNSAHIPRTGSAAYCASKAALSMAVRCEARESLRAREGLLAYVYEPGLLAGTPMTADAAAAFSGPLTRMQGEAARGLSVRGLAELIVANLSRGVALSGSRIPYDADEL